jgi:hypothetical protein
MHPNSTVTHEQHPHLPWYSAVVSRPHHQRAAPLCIGPQPSRVTMCKLLLAAEPCAAIGGGAHADVHTALHARNSHASPHWPPPIGRLADADAWCGRPIPHAACWSTFNDDRTTAALCIPHSSTRCTHPEQGRGTMPTHISTESLGAQQEVLPDATVVMHLPQLSCTSHGGPAAVSIHRQRRSHTAP